MVISLNNNYYYRFIVVNKYYSLYLTLYRQRILIGTYIQWVRGVTCSDAPISHPPVAIRVVWFLTDRYDAHHSTVGFWAYFCIITLTEPFILCIFFILYSLFDGWEKIYLLLFELIRRSVEMYVCVQLHTSYK